MYADDSAIYMAASSTDDFVNVKTKGTAVSSGIGYKYSAYRKSTYPFKISIF